MPTPARYTLIPPVDTQIPHVPSRESTRQRRRRFGALSSIPRIVLVLLLATPLISVALFAGYMPNIGLRLCVPGSSRALGCLYKTTTPSSTRPPLVAASFIHSTTPASSTSVSRLPKTKLLGGPRRSTIRSVPTTAATAPATVTATTLATMTDVRPGNLAYFLQSQNEEFIADLKKGKGKGWVVVSGNEAGDLDSLASAIAYAFLSSALDANRTAALYLTSRKLMNLRPENLLALQRANIPLNAILHPEDLPSGPEALADAGVGIALVDHNTLLPLFGNHPEAVVAVIDHHEDEGAYMSASPRLIRTPVGSTSSLVTSHFMPQWKASISGPAGATGSPVPPELATLLLSAILIDTQGLKKGGKAVDVDYAAAEFLYPLSTLVEADAAGDFAVTDEAPDKEISAMQGYTNELITVKFNVTGVPTMDLLRRDYKQYLWNTSESAMPTLAVGLSTVPLSMKNQLIADGGWKNYIATVDQFMAEHDIDIEGVLTTFKSETKRKSKREILLVVRSGGRIPDIDTAKRILSSIAAGLEAQSDEFSLAPWGQDKNGPKGELAAESAQWLINDKRVGAVWDQGNHHSTRKQVAPAMAELVGKL